MGATEIVQAVVSPAEKLIEAVSGAIGKAYEPRHVRKIAEAKAYELKLIADAVRNNSDVPIVYDSTGVSIDTSNYEEIAKRASCRLAFQEITKQQNIEAVVDRAYDELSGEESANSEPVSQDWMSRFFNSVEDIGDEKMQEIWARILAGEIRLPNTYSYRTLECLRSITRLEAELFLRVSSLALRHAGTYFVAANNDLLNQYGVPFSNILKLEECELMSAQNLSLTLSASTTNADYICNSKYIGFIKGTKPEMQKVVLSIFVFTESGRQLIKAIQPQETEQYLFDYLQFIQSKNEETLITGHVINTFNDDGSINYNPVNILATGSKQDNLQRQ